MSTPDNSLFLLIKALSERERRNFVRYSNSNGKSPYNLPLFEAVSSQESYDEDEIKEKFKEQPFIKHLSATKYHLKNAIFRSIRKVGMARNETVWDLFQDAKFCLQRKVYPIATKLAERLRKQCEEEELFLLWEECIGMQKRIALETLELEDYLRVAEELESQLLGLRSLRAELENLEKIRDNSLKPFKKRLISRGVSDANEVRALDKVKADLTGKVRSNRAKREKLILKFGLAHYNGKFKEAQKVNEKIVGLYRDAPFLISDHFEDYIDRRLIEVAFEFEFGNFDRAVRGLKELKIEPAAGDFQQMVINDRYWLTALSFEIDKPGSILKESDLGKIIAFVETHPISQERKIRFYFRLSVIFLNRFEFGLSMHWSKKILFERWGEVLIDFQCMARIILLLAILAQGDIDAMEVFHRPTERFLRKRKGLFQLEKIVLKQIKKGISDYPEVLRSIEKEIKKKVAPEDLKLVSRYFDIENWIKSVFEKN